MYSSVCPHGGLNYRPLDPKAILQEHQRPAGYVTIHVSSPFIAPGLT
jgi:hypothetical protein